MRDAREGQRALHVGRGQRAEVTGEQGEYGADAEERGDLDGEREEGTRREDEQRERAGGLGGGAEERGRRGRGALVDVRDPGVEGEGAELEGDAAEDEGHAREGERRDRARGGLGGERLADLREVERVGHAGDRAERAVDEDDAHQEQGGAETARDEVFHAGFKGGGAAAQVAHEDVEADGGRLEGQEERHEVVGLRQQHERGGHDQQHVMVVGHGGVAFAQEAFGEEARQQGGEQEDQAHAVGRQVLTEQTGERLDVGGLGPRTGDEAHQGHEDQAGAGGDGDERAQGFRQQHRLQEAQQREAGDGELRENGQPVGRTRGEEFEGRVDGGEERSHRTEKISAGRVGRPWRERPWPAPWCCAASRS